jgi:osmotically-inducible protein OsmY
MHETPAGGSELRSAQATPGAARMAVLRGDASIRDEILGALAQAPWLDTGDVVVAVHRGEVLLEGTVSEPRVRTALHEIAARCRGVQALHDRLEVARDARQL